jgi:hypothetical protein
MCGTPQYLSPEVIAGKGEIIGTKVILIAAREQSQIVEKKSQTKFRLIRTKVRRIGTKESD